MKINLLTLMTALFLCCSIMLKAQSPKGFSIKPSQTLKKLPALQSIVLDNRGNIG